MKRAFTLVELLVTTAIFLILTTLLLPNVQTFMVRAKVSKVGLDLNAVRGALTAYYADYSSYPPECVLPLTHFLEIDEYYMLTKPVAYISKIPHSPWLGVMQPVDRPEPTLKPHGNYALYTGGIWAGSNAGEPGWTILGSGPTYISSGMLPERWYSITNGLHSKGGFYMDSSGRTSLR